jgi:anthranilate synthase component I
LFDSAANGPLGRWSILAAFPRQRLSLEADGRLCARTGSADSDAATIAVDTGFLNALELAWRGERSDTSVAVAAEAAAFESGSSAVAAHTLPFRGGWVVYLSYEMAAEVEPGLRLPTVPHGPPRAVALRVPAALLYDHVDQRCYAIAERDASELLQAVAARVAALEVDANISAWSGPPINATGLLEDDPAAFKHAVLAAQHYIRAGDIYQANLSRRWQLALASPPSAPALYLALRAANPAPFAAWAQLPGLQLFSSSPERLVCVRGSHIETRPIAGTRPRLQDSQRELAAMLASPKERAEHVMLIDLERSDLGRVCEAGSVSVDEFMVAETYTHVHHIVSSVRGRLRAAVSPVEVLRALFPGGTITGCPKYRCMQVIAELERAPRGAYTGSLGYINHDGSMDFNILIRSLTVSDGLLEFRAGAGIVADSDWQSELAETRAKALGMLRALGAQGGSGQGAGAVA